MTVVNELNSNAKQECRILFTCVLNVWSFGLKAWVGRSFK